MKTRVASILNALRSALDQATYAASVELGAKEEALDRLYFPFEGTKQAFENAFKENGRAKYIPKELHPFLEKLSVYPEDKAYEGGNTLLYAISKITNPNKHKTTHRVSLKFFGKMFVDNFKLDGFAYELWLPPKFQEDRNEYWIARTDLAAKITYDFKFSAQLSFGPAPFIENAPVVGILDKLTSVCEGVVLGIEAETARLKAAKST